MEALAWHKSVAQSAFIIHVQVGIKLVVLMRLILLHELSTLANLLT